MSVDWECIPDDAIEAIVVVLCQPLRRNLALKDCAYAYSNLLVTNKQFSRVTARLDFDWFKLMISINMRNERFFPDLSDHLKQQEALLDADTKLQLSRTGLSYMPDDVKKMAKTLVLSTVGMPMVRGELDRFMGKHSIVYHTPKTGKIYRGYVGVRKLASMKIEPQVVRKQFKEIAKRYETFRKKRLALIKALEAYVRKAERTEERHPGFV